MVKLMSSFAIDDARDGICGFLGWGCGWRDGGDEILVLPGMLGGVIQELGGTWHFHG